MAVSSPPRGLIIDVITPLKRGGDIDGRGLGKHLDRILPHAQALLLSSPHIGEGLYLTTEQKEELLEKALVVVRGQVPILFWITGDTGEKTEKTLLILKKRLGARYYTGPVFWADTPLYYHSNRGLPLHYRNLSTMVKEPFVLQNNPELIKTPAAPFKRHNIRTSILKELVRIENISSMVFLGSLDRAHNYRKAVRSRTEFRFYDGDEANFLGHPSRSGVVSVGANLSPRAWQRVTAASLGLDGNRKDYPDHLQQIWELGEYLHRLKDHYERSGVALIKEVLSETGIIADPVCSFKAETLSEETERLKELMKDFGDYP